MFDWVGGRTSITSAVGLLPGALIGCDIRDFLAGASQMDATARAADLRRNPAALMAASGMWPVVVAVSVTWLFCYRDRLRCSAATSSSW